MIPQLLDENYWNELEGRLFRVTGGGVSIPLKINAGRHNLLEFHFVPFMNLIQINQTPLYERKVRIGEKLWTYQELLSYCESNLVSLKKAMINSINLNGDYGLSEKEEREKFQLFIKKMQAETNLEVIFTYYKNFNSPKAVVHARRAIKKL